MEYEITKDKLAIIATDTTTGEKTIELIGNLLKRRTALERSKKLNLQSFDTQIAQIDSLLNFIESKVPEKAAEITDARQSTEESKETKK